MRVNHCSITFWVSQFLRQISIVKHQHVNIFFVHNYLDFIFISEFKYSRMCININPFPLFLVAFIFPLFWNRSKLFEQFFRFLNLEEIYDFLETLAERATDVMQLKVSFIRSYRLHSKQAQTVNRSNCQTEKYIEKLKNVLKNRQTEKYIENQTN